jgi:hypothetical protein
MSKFSFKYLITINRLLLCIILFILFHVISDCKKSEVEFPTKPCKIPTSVGAWMDISLLSPANGNTSQPINPILTWQHWLSENPTEQRFHYTYDVYFGMGPNLLAIISNQTEDYITLNGLDFNTTYYWKICTKYQWSNNGVDCSLSTETEIHSFTTVPN